jgi:Mg-chelatase subunit ChlD
MHSYRGMFLSLAVSLTAATTLFAAGAPVKAQAKKVDIEVVFCLDTTGSMGGLIEGAKKKIWAICNQIAGDKPTPNLKVGMVAYKDRGDVYVTKVFDLTSDLDTIHTELRKFTADGGGDEPESVNQALDDAVNKIKWSTDKKTLRMIFLVGDAAPHMDYADDVKYPVTCKKAVEKNIIINAIQCGTSADCTKYWKDIAVKAEGSYAAIPQEGGVVAVATPFDAKLAELNTELTKTAIVYGSDARRKAGEEKRALAGAIPTSPVPTSGTYSRAAGGIGSPGVAGGAPGKPTVVTAAPAAAPLPALEEAADRAAFASKTDKVLDGDLLGDIKDKKVELAKIKDAELPEELKKLKTVEERKAYLEKVAKKRAELNKEILALDAKRADFVKKELEKAGKDKGKDAFDSQVLEMIRARR